MRRETRRAAFTLTEMLIATALTLLIMVILTSAFQVGLDTFRKMKVAGDLQEKLRAATIALRADLSAPHFNDPDTNKRRGPYLSDYDVNGVGWGRSAEGYVQIVAPAATPEGVDGDGNPCSRATNHSIHLTCKRPGTSRADVFLAAFPGGADPATRFFHREYAALAGPNAYAGQWAEVSWFLDPYTPNATTPDGVRRYRLCRRQRTLIELGATDKSVPGGAAAADAYDGMSMNAARTAFADLGDVTKPGERVLITNAFPGPGLHPMYGDDVVLPDVLSFEIKANWDGTPAPGGNELPYDYLPATFDTMPSGPPPVTVPLPIRIKSLQIRLRIWDVKSESTRQITLVQDM